MLEAATGADFLGSAGLGLGLLLLLLLLVVVAIAADEATAVGGALGFLASTLGLPAAAAPEFGLLAVVAAGAAAVVAAGAAVAAGFLTCDGGGARASGGGTLPFCETADIDGW